MNKCSIWFDLKSLTSFYKREREGYLWKQVNWIKIPLSKNALAAKKTCKTIISWGFQNVDLQKSQVKYVVIQKSLLTQQQQQQLQQQKNGCVVNNQI